MRATSKILALALTAALQPAVAGVVSLNFEDTTSISNIGARYAALGVNFLGDAWSITSNQGGCGGGVSFSRPGSCAGLMLADLATPGPASRSFTIDIAEGFITEFSFVFGVRSSAAATVEIFDGLGGTGTRLKSAGLSGFACDDDSLLFCEWNAGNIGFSGTARSVVVKGSDSRLMLDDLRFTTPASGVVPGRLPEPGSIALVLGALGALGWARKRASR